MNTKQCKRIAKTRCEENTKEHTTQKANMRCAGRSVECQPLKDKDNGPQQNANGEQLTGVAVLIRWWKSIARAHHPSYPSPSGPVNGFIGIPILRNVSEMRALVTPGCSAPPCSLPCRLPTTLTPAGASAACPLLSLCRRRTGSACPYSP